MDCIYPGRPSPVPETGPLRGRHYQSRNILKVFAHNAFHLLEFKTRQQFKTSSTNSVVWNYGRTAYCSVPRWSGPKCVGAAGEGWAALFWAPSDRKCSTHSLPYFAARLIYFFLHLVLISCSLGIYHVDPTAANMAKYRFRPFQQANCRINE